MRSRLDSLQGPRSSFRQRLVPITKASLGRIRSLKLQVGLCCVSDSHQLLPAPIGILALLWIGFTIVMVSSMRLASARWIFFIASLIPAMYAFINLAAA